MGSIVIMGWLSYQKNKARTRYAVPNLWVQYTR